MPTHIQAQLRLRSPQLSRDEIAAMIGVLPNHLNPAPAVDSARAHIIANTWVFTTPMRDESNDYHLSHCVEGLCDSLGDAKQRIHRAVHVNSVIAVLSCVAQCMERREPILYFSPELLARVIEFGAHLDIDIYRM